MDVIYLPQHNRRVQTAWLMINGSQSTQTIEVEKKEADPVLPKRRRTLQNTL